MKQIYRLLAIVLAIVALWRLQLVALIVLVSFMLTIIVLPFVRILHRYKLPSFIAVLTPLLAFVGLLTGVGFYIAPSLTQELPKFFSEIPNLLGRFPVIEALGIQEQDIRQIVRERFTDIGSFALLISATLAQAFGVSLTVLVLTVYWLRGYDPIKKTLVSYVPKEYQVRAEDIWLRAEVKLSRWFLGQMLISSVVGVTVWLAMLAIGVPFAGVLGIIAALLEIIPLIGPVLASVPAILFGLSESLEFGLIVTAVYIVIQQLESQILSPMLMGRAVHLHPIVVLVSFLIGSILYGILGGLLAVPMALLLSAGVDSFRNEKVSPKQVARVSS